ncbi:MAG: bifunctional (p)ppGpp synthetase/guanosine-3',5'-bis(diphosphate) 3'-pyrophosphohydrolase [Erysipelotrichaceae bacterium]|nr:bifunctional (p)ppGpp synthetase/guanosine-3',5'-bis(diphosphate) 3'-pyrophosphohydrolase [Erysipelotrichaceae bacterium]
MDERGNHTYLDIEDIFTRYIHKKEDIALIRSAYEYAEEKHRGQFRKSGDPYIVHLIEVGYILASLQGGPSTIAAGFLHDTIEDCDVTKDEISEKFGEDIAEIVFCLTKIKALSHNRRHDKDFVAEGHRKIFLGMAKDVRVIIIKLADRLHNMRTLDFQTPEKKRSISKETLDVYVPIADRLGLSSIKGELEDYCVKYLHPEEYEEICKYLDENMKNRQESILYLQKKIADLLIPTKIPFDIYSRVKHVSSIYRKLINKEKTLDQIYDIFALRIITESELNCYEILGLIHSEYRPLPGRFKDYIAVPKRNMYQSLHTTIIDRDSTILEVQIRTKEMDEIAEGGVAAHWRYKENKSYDPKKEQQDIMEKLHWFSDFISISSQDESAMDYMTTLQNEIFGASIYCFTPHGKVINLPTGSTPLDFAYKIHSKVGDQAIGAIVNNVLVPLSTELKTGDVIEIKTNAQSNGPNEGWLKLVKTTQARNHIRRFLMKKNANYLRDTVIEKGKNAIVEMFREFEISEQKMVELITDSVLKQFQVESLEDLYYAIGNKTVQPSDITKFLNIRRESFVESLMKKTVKPRGTASANQAVLVKGESNILCNLSSCCSPIPGDDIVGYITQGKGIKVHRKDCPNILKETKRLIDVWWNPEYKANNCPVELAIKATDRDNLVIDILNVLAQNKINCSKLITKLHAETGTVSIYITINVSSLENLNIIKNILVNISHVYLVERVTH